MSNGGYVILLEQIRKLVNEDGSWHDKCEALLNEASDDDKTALFEFVSWFDETTDDGVEVPADRAR